MDALRGESGHRGCFGATWCSCTPPRAASASSRSSSRGAAVATFGQVVFFGDANGPVPPIDVEALYARSARVGAFNLAFDDAPARWAEAKPALVDLVASGALSVDISRTLPLAAAAPAHHALESWASTGKLVLVPDGPPR
jgi:NADPH:quinone reductase-like Zn-dependent oxidoreductase